MRSRLVTRKLQVDRTPSPSVTAELLHGEPVAARIREEATDRVRELSERAVVPTLGTVLMSDDPADERFMDLKHDACGKAGITTRDLRLDPTAPATRLYRAVDRLCADCEVHAVFIQVPLPDHVSTTALRRRFDPAKDVDCFHPENLGRLVVGDPRFVPATPAAVRSLLAAYDVPVEGKDVVIVGRSDVIGKPLANLLLRNGPRGDATVTVCHSRTSDLGEKTRRADVVVTTCGVPELVDGSMLRPGATVVDVSANQRPTDDGNAELVGDVEFESARGVARAITPVPGGVGPVTLSMLLRNVVLAAERRPEDGVRA
jgi:methylenetetrahydrofolate dehydrogenase (NADP+) / methenyltetrahydrofolate cyclohydrolase